MGIKPDDHTVHWTKKDDKHETHGRNAHLYIQLWLNRILNLDDAMRTNQSQLFGQNMHDWKTAIRNISVFLYKYLQ